MKTITLGGVHAACRDEGDGDPVVFVHCSSATHRAWSFVADELSETHRVLAPDLLGYGASSPWPPRPPLPDENDLDVVEAVIERAGRPVHLVGHSYGGAICLEAARRAAEAGSDRVRSLFLVEPVSFHLLRTGGRPAEWEHVAAVARRCIAASARGDAARAAAPYMSFWLGRLKWWLMPRRARREVIRTVHKVASEFEAMFLLDHTPAEYVPISCPTRLVRGSRTRRPATAVVELLSETIAGASVGEIPGAGHMSLFTHRAWLRAAIRDHLGVA